MVYIAALIAVTLTSTVFAADYKRIVLFPGYFHLIAILAFAYSLYAARVLFTQEYSELSHVASRFVLLLIAASFCHILRNVSLQKALNWYALGAALLACLAVFIALTGLTIFEAPRPSRDLGVTLPLMKTAGVPRSFGEQGIVVAIVLSYVLVFWSNLSRTKRGLAIATVVSLQLTGQSRNMILSMVIVVVAWILVRKGTNAIVASVLLAGSSVSTFLVEQVYPSLADTGLGSSIVGEGVLESNVTARFQLVQGAMKLITEQPAKSLIGWSHSEWLVVAPFGLENNIHNHFIALLIYLGLPIGILTIALFFVVPLLKILGSIGSDSVGGLNKNTTFVIVCGCGVLSSLNFYEGFFSISLAVYVGLVWSMAYIDISKTSREYAVSDTRY
ncbi:hypothetical protein ABIE38_002596 [Dietzia sp. 2505]|uniref:hypothetical protein n=1 Tax=Dietzia sp. 2505 TaxID=3156457 RepID=UPI0033938E78